MAANYVLLERIELNASAASVTFASIPQSGYTDLKVVYSARSDAATTDRGMFVRFNGDTASNYTYKFVRGDGSSAGSGGTTTTFLYFGNFNAGTSTSNTFGNGEFVIPNYLGSTQKSVSSDSVSENNATSAWTTLAAGLWSGTSAISTVLLYPEGGNFVANSTFSLYGLAAVGTTPAIAPKASGGNIQTDGTYWYHTFLSSGAFVPQTGLSCDYLVVAGGGGGGAGAGGGGGAGAFRTATAQSVTATSYTVTVGAGGTGVTGTNVAGNNGSDSVFNALTSVGGGGGGAYANVNGVAGGSGGGAGGAFNGTGGAGTTGGNAGGNSINVANIAAGGGGGAGAAGGVNTNNGQNSVGGAGGVGLSTAISGGATTGAGQLVSSTYYFAGGGGGAVYTTGTPGAGGSGGGGTGALVGSSAGTAGTVNTGGGGGGDQNGQGKAGGSGIVIIRYPIA